ncbi:MAG TPA: hypothetical protein VEX86_00865, partial [Longimicrobium sp.]|nr:hypothetical protein [Longimicrobium sp.]
DFQWLSPWHAVEDLGPRFAGTFAEVLRREVAPGHPLHGVPVEAIGKRDASDDVLFRLLDGSGRVAMVHLTWTSSPPERPPWPATALFASLEEWAADCMRYDHENPRG